MDLFYDGMSKSQSDNQMIALGLNFKKWVLAFRRIGQLQAWTSGCYSQIL